MMDFAVVDNVGIKRFEASIEEQIAFIEYIKTKDIIYLTHTEVPKSLEGKGIGSTLIRCVLETIKQENLKLAPLCPFVAAYLIKNPKWQSILAKGFNVS